jgi:hypothetical protein
MPADNNTIDDFFQQQYRQFEPGNLQQDADWQQMNQLLNDTPRPGRRKKNIRRRIIRYMGGLALVTTVTYYTINRQQGVRYQQKQHNFYSNHSQKKIPQTVPYTAKRIQAVTPKNTAVNHGPLLQTKWRSNYPDKRQVMLSQHSDTVLLTRPINNADKSTLPVKNFLAQLAQPVQQFYINPARDTLLLCAEGTVLHIRAFTFMHPLTNKYIKDSLVLVVRECYDYTSMFANQLRTLSEDGPLVTGGMVYLAATIGNSSKQPLVVRPIELQMPMTSYDPAMQLYLPITEKDSSKALQQDNWVAAGQVQAYKNNIIFRGRTHIKIMDVQQRVSKDEKSETAYFQVQPLVDITGDKIKALIQNRYSGITGRIVIEKTAVPDEKTVLKNTRAMATGKGFVMADSILLPFKEAVAEKLISQRDSLRFTALLRMDSLLYQQTVQQDSIAFLQKMAFEKAYRFNISGLGWVNCDKLMKPGVPQVDFVIRYAPGEAPSNGLYNLVFTNIKSIIKGQYINGNIHFGILPVGEPVQLICIAEQQGKAFRVSNEAAGQLIFEPTSPAKMQQQLAAIDAALVF